MRWQKEHEVSIVNSKPLEEPLSKEQSAEHVGGISEDGPQLSRAWRTVYAKIFDRSESSKSKEVIVAAVGMICAALLCAILLSPVTRHALLGKPTRNVAFIGNSMMYFYDLPRSVQLISGGKVRQNSILRGGASFSTLLERENGMWNRWRTQSALLETLSSSTNDDDQTFADNSVWDFGACTIQMLLLGHKPDEAQSSYDDWWSYRQACDLEDDNGWKYGTSANTDYRFSNPCMQSQAYLNFLRYLPQSDIRVSSIKWDFVVMNDNTMKVRYQGSRETELASLEAGYLPLLLKSGARPVFLVTHAYCMDDASNSNDDGVTDAYDDEIPYWTVQTYEGYRQYASFLAEALPRSQKPRLANSGAAFLTVYEERPDLWPSLFWADRKHPGPHGALIQTCLVHYAIYGHAGGSYQDITSWGEEVTTTRSLMYPKDTTMPLPTQDEATYLYDVCRRVAHGYLPPSFRKEMQAQQLSLYS